MPFIGGGGVPADLELTIAQKADVSRVELIEEQLAGLVATPEPLEFVDDDAKTGYWGGASTDIPLPTHEAGDLLIAVQGGRYANLATGTVGFTSLDVSGDNGLFYDIASGGATTCAMTTAWVDHQVALTLAIRGYSPTVELEHVGTNTAAALTNLTVPQVLYLVYRQGDSGAISPPSGVSLEAFVNVTGGLYAYTAIPIDGAVPARTWTNASKVYTLLLNQDVVSQVEVQLSDLEARVAVLEGV